MPSAVLIAIGTAAACAAPPHSAGAPAAAQAPPARPYDPRHEAAFDALAAAVAAHDDALARRILERLLARNPDADSRAFAESFGRILTGRELAAGLELYLVASGVAQDPDRVVLELCGRHGSEQALAYQSGPGTLHLLLTGVDELGTEHRVSRVLALPAVARLDLPAQRNSVVDLGTFEVPPSNALALLAEWELVLRPGTIRAGQVDYPANEVAVRGCETLRRADWLPRNPIPPESLADYVAAGGRAQPALMERAVRVDLDDRDAALDALAPEALKLSRPELPALLPALRWLSGRRELGADPDAWQRWLEQRVRALEAADPARPAIDLPETGRRPGAIVPGSAADPGAGQR